MNDLDRQAIGPLMIDIQSFELNPLEKEQLAHPLVGGVILFSRNHENMAQLKQLCHQIHSISRPRHLLIAVDHEGGRVQRFRDGFTKVPAMRTLGENWDPDAPELSCEQASKWGHCLARELREVGVDLSFAPVLDLDWGHSEVIGDRSFHRDVQAVMMLAQSFIHGMKQAKMAYCGKHFPGHGWVQLDSHHALPVDPRSLEEMKEDILPYQVLPLDSAMMAHVVYEQFDSLPASLSIRWIDWFRKNCDFQGAIFCDDLSMQGAVCFGDILERSTLAFEAGCDMLPICNHPDSVVTLLDRWKIKDQKSRTIRLEKLFPRF